MRFCPKGSENRFSIASKMAPQTDGELHNVTDKVRR